jgi:hypothetical protein
MEDELAPRIGRTEVEYRYQIFFSEVWVGGVYETMRLLLNERKFVPDSGEYRALFNDLELLRITIDKHDIAKQRDLKAPLQMMTYDQKDVHVFIKGDPQRSHIMSIAVSVRGSLMWQAIDGRTAADRWIERRSLSDRMIALWGEQGSLKAE